MAITDNEAAFVDASAVSIDLSQTFTVTAGSSDPAYLVLTVLDRDEYTAGASGATGTLTGNGHTLSLSSIGGDGRGTGIVFTYNAGTGQYYNSTYGYLNQLVFNSSSSAGDVTNLSLFGTSSLSLANNDATNAVSMMELDGSGYLGSATVVTRPGYTSPVPSQATPDSIASAAKSFIGQAWNEDGCWVLASTISAEAGASLPVQSTLIGLPGQANGEWIVAFNGPAGQSGNWENMVTAGEMIVIGTPGGGGHITTCVSGSGSTAMLVDNIEYVNGSGQVQNPANDGSSADIIVSAPHLASQEWAGVAASSVVIYELDTPIVTTDVASDSLACLASLPLGSLFSATDPANKTITSWQAYDTATSNFLVLGGVDYSDHSSGDALTAATLSSLSLLAGSTVTTDTLEVRAYNGSYWGDWEALSVAITATAPVTPKPPVLETQTPSQTWIDGKSITLALPSTTFEDLQNETLTCTAMLSSGAALPSWLGFNAATGTFTGTAPPAAESLTIKVTATDTSNLSVSETFSATVIGPPVVTTQTPSQTWTEGKPVSLKLPATTFTDPQGETLSYAAAQVNGQALPAWLTFNAATETFSGTAPATAQTLDLEVTGTDSSGLSVSDIVVVTVAPPGPVLTTQTPNQSWKEGSAMSLPLPTNTFTDPTGEKLTYTATQQNGQPLPSWLVFNAVTDSFSGTAPNTAETVDVKVTATDTSGLSVSDVFLAAILGPPAVTDQTPNQSWTEGKTFSLTLPANTFTDPQGEALTYTATQQNGQALPGWLVFNPTTDSFSGTAPSTAQTVDIKVTATDTSGLATPEVFDATVQAAAATPKPGIAVTAPTPSQVWTDGEAVALALPANTFTDALGLKMTFAAYEIGGPNVTSWLYFNPATDELFGAVPMSMRGTVELAVIATDSQHMIAEDLFSVTFAPNPSGHTGIGAATLGMVTPVDSSQVAALLTLHG
ncbi:MAG TPA: putative Ig domain-containing protein [Acetobacteraceae bacterium]|nr:putative Ig domain-containing protein [Acetobacteraceae bacterium]